MRTLLRVENSAQSQELLGLRRSQSFWEREMKQSRYKVQWAWRDVGKISRKQCVIICILVFSFLDFNPSANPLCGCPDQQRRAKTKQNTSWTAQQSEVSTAGISVNFSHFSKWKLKWGSGLSTLTWSGRLKNYARILPHQSALASVVICA